MVCAVHRGKKAGLATLANLFFDSGPDVSIGLCLFLNRRSDTDILTVPNFKHCFSGASLVQCCDKGQANHVVQAVTTFMDFLGFKKTCLRTAGELALGVLAQAIKSARNDETQLETTVSGQIRRMRIALEQTSPLVSRITSSSGSVDRRVASARDFTCKLTDSRLASD